MNRHITALQYMCVMYKSKNKLYEPIKLTYCCSRLKIQAEYKNITSYKDDNNIHEWCWESCHEESILHKKGYSCHKHLTQIHFIYVIYNLCRHTFNRHYIHLVDKHQRMTTQLLFSGWWNLVFSLPLIILRDSRRKRIIRSSQWHPIECYRPKINELTVFSWQQPQALVRQLQQVAQW